MTGCERNICPRTSQPSQHLSPSKQGELHYRLNHTPIHKKDDSVAHCKAFTYEYTACERHGPIITHPTYEEILIYLINNFKNYLLVIYLDRNAQYCFCLTIGISVDICSVVDIHVDTVLV